MEVKWKQPENSDIDALTKICGQANVFTDLAHREHYGHDETEDLSFPPMVVLKPSDTQQVSAILTHCNEHHIPVTPIGARTGLSGGALSIFGGVAISMERFDKIIAIDERNLQMTVEPAVITQVLQEAAEQVGLYYPPDPASRGSCSIGGNLSENSGGPHAVKYGVTADYVLNLEVVLPSGEVIWTGANTLKNSTGYNLTQLIVGSEGTLGIITKAVLRLIPKPQMNKLLLVPFYGAADACKAVAAIFRAGVVPSAMEFMERDAIDLASAFAGVEVAMEDRVEAHLLIEVDGNQDEVIMQELTTIMDVLATFETGEVLFADDHAKKEELWNLRRKVGEAVKAFSIYKEEDTVVPRYALPQLLDGVKAIGSKYGFRSVCYGHAGDGNLHVNILKGTLSDEVWNEHLQTAIEEIFKLTISLGGTISGEHGIGYVQKSYMPLAFSKIQLDLMQRIKEAFDPNGIMNPGKIFPDVQNY